MKYVWKKRISILPLIICACLIFSVVVYAQAGTVYTCTIHPCYEHPVTKVIEDAAGENGKVTGQGMIEGVVNPRGIMEVTQQGEYYLTVRLSLMDYTENHVIQVQNANDTSWQTMAMGVTAQGSDSNGTTADICIQVPSESCIVRISMNVIPMGREVVFYLYPSKYTEGNSTDMTPTIVTDAQSSVSEQSAVVSPSPSAIPTATSDPTAQPTTQPQESSGAVSSQTAQQDEGLILSTQNQQISVGNTNGGMEIVIGILIGCITFLLLVILKILVKELGKRKQ